MSNYAIALKAKGMGFDAHLTMLFVGELTEAQQEKINKFIKPYANREYLVERGDIRMFGANTVPVVTVIPPIQLHNLRQILVKSGMPNPSEFNWNPHITLKANKAKEEIIIPRRIRLHSLYLD